MFFRIKATWFNILPELKKNQATLGKWRKILHVILFIPKYFGHHILFTYPLK